MDIQQLPALQGRALQGRQGFEYKISLIHLKNRWKYSEIHDDCSSQTVASVYQKAMDNLPPFFITFTDNAMYFTLRYTMRYTAHPERKTAFTKTVEAGGHIHALIQKGCPWKNGIIERSNRTDKEECFAKQRFLDSEHRRYQLRLWEMHYNTQRPHQGLNNQTPLQVFKQNYPLHTTYRML